MTARMTRNETWGYFERVLKSGVVAERGHVAALDLNDSGKLVKMVEDTGLLPIGYFDGPSFDGSVTGDGTKKVQVRLFDALQLHRFNNDTVTALADADVGQVCYFKDYQTVSKDGTGRSPAGRVWAVTAAGVLIQPIGSDDDVAVVTNDIMALTVRLTDVSTASSAYVASPIAGTIQKIVSVLEAAISGADSAVTTYIGATPITGGGFTVAQSGSAAGDVDQATPSAANVVAVGDPIKVTTDGASTGTAGLVVTFLIRES